LSNYGLLCRSPNSEFWNWHDWRSRQSASFNAFCGGWPKKRPSTGRLHLSLTNVGFSNDPPGLYYLANRNCSLSSGLACAETLVAAVWMRRGSAARKVVDHGTHHLCKTSSRKHISLISSHPGPVIGSGVSATGSVAAGGSCTNAAGLGTTCKRYASCTRGRTMDQKPRLNSFTEHLI
jgi:hypothetical protein